MIIKSTQKSELGTYVTCHVKDVDNLVEIVRCRNCGGFRAVRGCQRTTRMFLCGSSISDMALITACIRHTASGHIPSSTILG